VNFGFRLNAIPSFSTGTDITSPLSGLLENLSFLETKRRKENDGRYDYRCQQQFILVIGLFPDTVNNLMHHLRTSFISITKLARPKVYIMDNCQSYL